MNYVDSIVIRLAKWQVGTVDKNNMKITSEMLDNIYLSEIVGEDGTELIPILSTEEEEEK